MVILGIDWGRARVGVAISDELGLLAHPIGQWEATSLKKMAAQMSTLVHERHVERIVVGLPKNMDGSEGDSAMSARRWGKEIETLTKIPVVFQDERLSSWAADQMLHNVGRRSPKKKKQKRDQLAACVILQGYLDGLKK